MVTPANNIYALMKKTTPQPVACWSSNDAHDLQYIIKTISNLRILWHKNSVGWAPRLINCGMSCRPAKPQPEWYCCVLLLFQMKNLISYLPSSFSFCNSNKSFQNTLWFHCANFNRYASALYFTDAVAQQQKSLVFRRNRNIHQE